MKILLPLIFLLAGVAVFVYLQMTRAHQPPVAIQERVWRVEVQEVAPATLSPTITLYGEVDSPDLLKAAAPAAAVVQQVMVREGEEVVRGQLLIELDQRDFVPGLEQAKADVLQLEAEIASERNRHQFDLQALEQEKKILALSNEGVVRAESLKQRSLGSLSALDDARQNAARQALMVISREHNIRDHESRLGQLEARLLRTRAQLGELELELDRSLVKAPFDGVVASLNVATGDWVDKSEVMLQMYHPETLEVRARIPAPYRDELQEALRGDQVIRGQSRSGNSKIGLQLERLSGEADPGGLDGLFHIDEGIEWLRMGDMLQIQVQRLPREKVIAVPYQSLYGGTRLYLLEEGRMRGLEITPLGSYVDPQGREMQLVAADGMEPGSLVITTHLPNAVTGLRIEAIE